MSSESAEVGSGLAEQGLSHVIFRRRGPNPQNQPGLAEQGLLRVIFRRYGSNPQNRSDLPGSERYPQKWLQKQLQR